MLSTEFLQKIEIETVQKSFSLSSNQDLLSWLMNITGNVLANKNIKEVVVGSRNYREIELDVSCTEKEVISFFNWQLRDKIFQKFNISHDNRKPRKWPHTLSADEAKKLLLNYAKKIGIPHDAEFSALKLDLQNHGTWNGYWIRRLNGFPYEDDSITVGIMPIDGEFYSYRKKYFGRTCPTYVNVTREDAISSGWDKIRKYIDEKISDNIKREYEVRSAELRIIQPNVFLGMVVPIWKSKQSRLAWVIEYELRAEPTAIKYENKLDEFGHHDKFILKFDSATNKFLGGETGPCK
jgi:hypothetical protein